MRWSDIDLNAKTLTISNNRVMAGTGVVVDNEPKTRSSRRTLPLTDQLAIELKAAKARTTAERLALGKVWEGSGYVVVDELGRAVSPDKLTRAWNRAVTKAGVSRIRLHDARHTCGTLMHLNRVPLAVISAWLGHTDAAFTLKTYAHSQRAALDDAAATYGALVTDRDNEAG
ncbi:site-specific integrase [Nocardia sp. GTS18]|uniref:site-specific integrase n=1 Tax=Nocardia sp. GTS18 TaxID=1778064 RepID=UPI0021052511|nr:site-specific integrase [Nocardia sp. GTS18]